MGRATTPCLGTRSFDMSEDTYDSRSRTQVTHLGEETMDEVCLAPLHLTP